jgi:hypothetical protein
MLKTFVAIFALLLVVATVPADGIPTSAAPETRPALIHGGLHSAPHVLRSLGLSQSTSHAAACCKICTVGKACGDTCISRDKECHIGPGCACDG